MRTNQLTRNTKHNTKKKKFPLLYHVESVMRKTQKLKVTRSTQLPILIWVGEKSEKTASTQYDFPISMPPSTQKASYNLYGVHPNAPNNNNHNKQKKSSRLTDFSYRSLSAAVQISDIHIKRCSFFQYMSTRTETQMEYITQEP